jgi:hypothetical protein
MTRWRRLIACAAVVAGVAAGAVGCSSSAGARLRAAADSPATATRDYLAAASCIRGPFCVAVGSDFGAGLSLAERWNGRRRQVMPHPAARMRLASVSCTSRSFCMAVGTWTNRRNTVVASRGLVWNGATWRLVTMPAALGAGAVSVSCATARFCVATGAEAARWNGVSWRLLPPLRYALGLASVACVSPSFCMVVGSQSNHQRTVVLSRALVWDGATWRATNPPSPGSYAALTGARCSSASRCVAAGWHGHCHQPKQPLGQECFFALRWDGITWMPLTSRPATPLAANLACWGAAGCVASGDCNEPANCRGTTTLVWNGRAWRQNTAPAPGRHGSSLDGAACWARSACIAVGGDVSSSGALVTLIEKWNGTRWQAFQSPSP